MDRYDPNDWNVSFVKREPQFCMSVLRDATEILIGLVDDGNYIPAISGFDRILNGLIVFQNAGFDFRSHICFFSWMEAEIIAFGLDLPESKRRNSALSLYEDARDFAKSEKTHNILSAIISKMKSSTPLSVIKNDFDPEFPQSVVEMLEDLHGRMVI